jgi:hypothetical protein
MYRPLPRTPELKKSTEIHRANLLTFTKQIRDAQALNRKGWMKCAARSTTACGFLGLLRAARASRIDCAYPKKLSQI